MIELNDAQIWTVVGVLAATLVSTVGLMAHFTTKLLQEAIGRVLDQIDARFTGLDYRFEAIDHRFEAIDHRFEALEHRFDALGHRFEAIDHRFDALDSRIDVLDRDVQAIANRAFGGASAAES